MRWDVLVLSHSLSKKVEAQDQEKAQGLKDSSVQTRALEGFRRSEDDRLESRKSQGTKRHVEMWKEYRHRFNGS